MSPEHKRPPQRVVGRGVMFNFVNKVAASDEQASQEREARRHPGAVDEYTQLDDPC